ncbi:hypothetical protein [Lentzea jiangxiensis]|uniref:hypothetical protein n=1 Tax=Lentzea jiangxiensis TaxID=641025 RepID=UPI000B7FF5CF|nr:hypothetical protein [Lentzea jiangxiensis]
MTLVDDDQPVRELPPDRAGEPFGTGGGGSFGRKLFDAAPVRDGLTGPRVTYERLCVQCGLDDVLPTHRVAVVGIGGLGHLALQFSNKWGWAVTAISTTKDKQADAERFGATSFIASREPGALRAAAASFDFVLSTVPDRPISVSALGLVSEAKEIVGGIVGTVAETRQMLGFAARHAIRPEVEMFALTDFEQALDRVRKGNVRYRAVVDFT